MRPSTALSADGPLNLYNAVVTAAAKESKDKGVLVDMNGLILGAQSTVKMNTVDVQTFQAPNSGALGYVLNGKVFYNQVTLKKHTTQSVFDVTHLNALPKVGIVYSYSNIEADMVTPMLSNGYKGIIHAGVGNGNIHQNIFPVLTDARCKEGYCRNGKCAEKTGSAGGKVFCFFLLQDRKDTFQRYYNLFQIRLITIVIDHTAQQLCIQCFCNSNHS